MKADQSGGLVMAGGLNQSFLTRLPVLLCSLGPVKGASLRVSRRIANSLRAGFAVTEYAALEPCRLIWLAVPDIALAQVVHDLAAQVPLEGKMVVLCGSLHDSKWPGALHTAGALVASLNAIEPSDERTLVAEGDARVMRQLRRLAAAEKRKFIEIQPGCKPLYLAGTHFATHLALPWIAVAVESLRTAGFSRTEATNAVEKMGTRILRAYGKAGRKAWSPSAPAELRAALGNAGSLGEPSAAMYTEGIREALRYFEDSSPKVSP